MFKIMFQSSFIIFCQLKMNKESYPTSTPEFNGICNNFQLLISSYRYYVMNNRRMDKYFTNVYLMSKSLGLCFTDCKD